MPRQSISLTSPNDDWLKDQVDREEYSSKSELVNDLIRNARKKEEQLAWLRDKLERSEKSGFSTQTKDEIRAEALKRINA
jgi:antitoxin ParD1/3/4